MAIFPYVPLRPHASHAQCTLNFPQFKNLNEIVSMYLALHLEFQGSEGEGTTDRPVSLVDVNGDVSQSLQRRHSVQRTANLKRSMTGNGGICAE